MAPPVKKPAAVKPAPAKKARKNKKSVAKSAKRESLTTVSLNIEVAAKGHPPEYFVSPSGQWIECFWNQGTKTYDRCHKINYKDIPRRR